VIDGYTCGILDRRPAQARRAGVARLQGVGRSSEEPGVRPAPGSTTEAEFRAAAEALRDTRPDGGWPYPWADDVFLTDFTYAFLDGETRVSSFHGGFHPASEVTAEGFVWPDEPDDPTTRRIPAPSGYDPSQPDSILIMRL
jgi:hypothetical protein